MSNEIEKFDPSRLMEGVKDRVKATFVSLIPDAQWEQMIKTECDKFFQPFKERNYYDRSKDLYSDFQMVCISVMQEVAKEKIIAYLEKYENNVWSNNEVVVNDLLMQEIKKHAYDIFVGMIGARVQTVINEMRSRNY